MEIDLLFKSLFFPVLDDVNPDLVTAERGINNEVSLADSNEPSDPFQEFFQRVQAEQTLAKRVRTATAGGWDEPIATRTAPAAAPPAANFVANSAARFAKACERIDRIFEGHPEEAAEAKRIAKEVLDQAPAEVLTAA